VIVIKDMLLTRNTLWTKYTKHSDYLFNISLTKGAVQSKQHGCERHVQMKTMFAVSYSKQPEHSLWL